MFEALNLREEAVRAEEEAIREQVRQLPDDQRAAFFHHYNKELRDPDTYAVLNWLFLAGLHHFYLGRFQRGLVNLVAMVVGLVLLLIGIGFGGLVILVVLLVELPALFRSQVIVMDYNNRLARTLLAGKSS